MSYSEALEQQIRLHRWAVRQGSVRGGFVEQIYGSFAWFHAAHEVLAAAERYYLNKEIGHLLALSSSNVPDMLPSPSLLPGLRPGFVWLEKPVNLPELATDGEPVPRYLHAFTWARTLRGKTGNDPARWEDVGWRELHAGEGELFLVPWVTTKQLDQIVPWSFFEWRWEETQSAAVEREAAEASSDSRQLDTTYARQIFDLCAAFLLFIQQRILTASQQSLDRHARHRVEKEDWQHEPLVRVVELRRREPVATEHGERDVDWSCQWIVRGHWRQQFYPSKHLNQPIWITPYVKGPEDKPLKPPRATVFAV